jgi:HK97 family phage major capsid protein
VSQVAARIALEAKTIFDAAEAEGRQLTADERTEVQSLLSRAEAARNGSKGIAPNIPPTSADAWAFLNGAATGPAGGGGPGAAFVASDGYKAIKNSASRPQQWSSGLIDVGLSMKGTILEGVGSPANGTGGGLVPIPMVVPGMVDKLFQPLTLENLLLAGQASGPTVRYVIQGTATSGAAGVAEGGTKPESTLAWSTVDERVKKIATSIVVSDEAIEDAPAVQQLINGQLTRFVQIEAERQLIRGTSGGDEVQGLLTSRSVPVYAGGTAAGNKAVQLFKAANGMRGSAFVEPEWFMVHPTDWQEIRLLTDTAGQYFGGGPFMGGYGNTGMAAASGQVTGATDYLWGKPVYLSATIGAGTALIGNSQSAQVWNRGGLSVEATNSHASNFVLNLTAIRAERRLALAVYRANGFVEARLA